MNAERDKNEEQMLKMSIQRMDTISQTQRQSVDELINASTIQMVGGNSSSAQTILKKARVVDPFDYRIYYNLFVLKWTTGNQKEASSNLKKSLSILYALTRSNLERSLQLWEGNSASHVIKIVELIEKGKIEQASNAISKAIKLSVTKHHILRIANMLDTALNKNMDKQAKKGQNTNNNSQFLLPVPSLQIKQSTNDDISIKQLIVQFNKLSKEFASANQFVSYASQPRVLFMRLKTKTSIDVEQYISESLGTLQLTSLTGIKTEEERSGGKEQRYANQWKKIENYSEEGQLYPITKPNFEIQLVKIKLGMNSSLAEYVNTYISYEYGYQKYKTNITNTNTLQPCWKSEGKIFSLERTPTLMKVSIYQRQIFKWDEEIGVGSFKITKEGEYTLPIYQKNRHLGFLMFLIENKN